MRTRWPPTGRTAPARGGHARCAAATDPPSADTQQVLECGTHRPPTWAMPWAVPDVAYRHLVLAGHRPRRRGELGRSLVKRGGFARCMPLPTRVERRPQGPDARENMLGRRPTAPRSVVTALHGRSSLVFDGTAHRDHGARSVLSSQGGASSLRHSPVPNALINPHFLNHANTDLGDDRIVTTWCRVVSPKMTEPFPTSLRVLIVTAGPRTASA